MAKLMQQIKSYGTLWFVLLSTLIAFAVSYGSDKASAALTMANHEIRIIKLEKDDEEYGKTLSRVDQRVSDIWRDLGHKDH